VQTTKLSNGFTVVSANMTGGSVSLSLAVDAGSRVNGTASHVLKHAAFKHTGKRSALRLWRDIEDMGASFSAEHGRDLMTYSGAVTPEQTGAAVEILAETTLDMKMAVWDFKEFAGVADLDTPNTVATALSENLHSAAFLDNTGLGGAMYGASSHAAATGAAGFGASTMVLAGAGCDHASLVAAAEASFGSASGGASAATAASYAGGESRTGADIGTTCVGLAFQGASASNSAAFDVLQVLLTKAGFNAFSANYRDTGLFGLYGNGDGAAVTAELSGAISGAAAAAPSAAALGAAKAAAKTALATSLESRSAMAAHLASSVLLNGSAASTADLVAAIDGVTAADVQSAAKSAIASGATLASIGDMSTMPHLSSLKF
jgi:predicted Zn-dependent peptidase